MKSTTKANADAFNALKFFAYINKVFKKVLQRGYYLKIHIYGSLDVN